MTEDEMCGDQKCGCRNMDQIKEAGIEVYMMLNAKFGSEGAQNIPCIFNALVVAITCGFADYVDTNDLDDFINRLTKTMEENIKENIRRGNII